MNMKERIIVILCLALAYSVQIGAQAPNWDYNPYAYQYDMTAYVCLSLDDQDIEDCSDIQIAAFCGDECRGIAEEKVSNGHKYTYLRIRSNVAQGETITFQTYDANSGKVAKGRNSIAFTSMATIGYPSSPYKIDAVNPYNVTFVIDGTEHASVMYYGDPITAPAETDKEGHTFEKWVPEVDATVPAHDVTYIATYSVNEYVLTWYLNDNIYHREDVAFGSPITVIEPEIPEGNDFHGWIEEIPETMPAHDVDIHGTYSAATAISAASMKCDEVVSVCTISGHLLYDKVRWNEIVDKLKGGVYIINGEKRVIRSKF